VKIDPISEGLNGGDDSGHKLAPGCDLEIIKIRPSFLTLDLILGGQKSTVRFYHFLDIHHPQALYS